MVIIDALDMHSLSRLSKLQYLNKTMPIYLHIQKVGNLANHLGRPDQGQEPLVGGGHALQLLEVLQLVLTMIIMKPKSYLLLRLD